MEKVSNAGVNNETGSHSVIENRTEDDGYYCATPTFVISKKYAGIIKGYR